MAQFNFELIVQILKSQMQDDSAITLSQEAADNRYLGFIKNF